MSTDKHDPKDEVSPLNASDPSPEELGEGDLEEAAGGSCPSFSCGLYRIFGAEQEQAGL